MTINLRTPSPFHVNLEPPPRPRERHLRITTPVGRRFNQVVGPDDTVIMFEEATIPPFNHLNSPDPTVALRTRVTLPVPRQPGDVLHTQEGYVIENITSAPQVVPRPDTYESLRDTMMIDMAVRQNGTYMTRPIGDPELSRYLSGGNTTTAAPATAGSSLSLQDVENARARALHSRAEAPLTPTKLIELLRDNVEVRTRLTLNGTDLTVRTQLVVRDKDKETIVSDDEDSVDLAELLDHL